MPEMAKRPTFFAKPALFRAWLERHHEEKTELWVGFRKKGSGKPSITWPEAVDEALCFGWIDGIRKRLDDESYVIRFTPRTPRSHWSLVNVRRVGELTREGRMRPAGTRAFEERSESRTGLASYERTDEPTLDTAHEKRFRAEPEAWRWFGSQAASYRKAAIHWVVSAKKEETRLKRLETLIADSKRGRTVPPLTRPDRKG
jgi:uncharacterized protein YdeI (YjbR/CyaY-like superfamily)